MYLCVRVCVCVCVCSTLMECVTSLQPSRRRQRQPGASAGAGRRLPADVINHDSATGRSDKMADASAGAKMATAAHMTRRARGEEGEVEGLWQRTRTLLMPVFPTGWWVHEGAGDLNLRRRYTEREGNTVVAVTPPELYGSLKEPNPSSMASVATPGRSASRGGRPGGR